MKRGTTVLFKGKGYSAITNTKRVPVKVVEFAGRYEVWRGDKLWCINNNLKAAMSEAYKLCGLEKQEG